MLKRVKNPRLARSKGAKKALLRGLALSLFEKGSIETSETRAKGVRSFIQSVLRVSENEELDLRRSAGLLGINKPQAKKVVILGKSLEKGQSATRTIRLGSRAGDMSPRIRLELLAKLPAVRATSKPKKPKEAKTNV
ncbi:MAG: L17 family ribosomal protein [Patescibacteria group bacterium]